MRRDRPALVLLAFVCALAVGCVVTAEDIETWKGTVKGPGKIVAVILADKYPIELRTRAALALVEMDRQDVDSVPELQSALQRVEVPTREQIIEQMVPGLEQLMRGSSAPQPTANGEIAPPTPQQVRAKDAGFVLITHARPNTRTRLVRAVVGWYTDDFNGRSLAGSYSAEQVIRALGSPAAAILVDAMNARMPSAALVKLAELIGQLGDAQTKARAGTRLVAISREIETPAFVSWMRQRAQQQLAEAGRPTNAATVNTVVNFNQEKFLTEGALPAMRFFADQQPVVERLLEVASTATNSEERRWRALAALEGKVKPEHLQRMLALALDANNPIRVRDYAFDRVGDIGSDQAIPRLWPLVQSGSDQRLRWRAGELVLALGGSGVVNDFFSRLPSGADVEYAPEELAGYATRIGQMTPLPTEIVRQQLASSQWFKRVTALRFYERKGTAADIAQMQRLQGDSTPTKGPGWQDGFTVGKVAESAIAALRQRLGTGH